MGRFASLLAMLLASSLAFAEPVPASDRRKIVDSVVQYVHTSYIDAAQASKLEPVLRAADFSRANDGEAFAKAVTTLMQGVTKDQHLRLLYSAKELPLNSRARTPAENAERQASLRAENFGIGRVERLPGNIGYLQLDSFAPAVEAAPSIAAAMTLLAYTDALIIDLRENGGGAAQTVPLIASYLFEEPRHLSDFYSREGNTTQQQWTYPAVAGVRFGEGRPVYILTSKKTFSAAEGFAFALKNVKRAVIVGETTRGGAHPSRIKRINAHYELMVPVSTVRDTVTGKDWEGVGVAPDVAVAAGEALTRAQLILLKKLLAEQPSAERQAEIKQGLDQLTR